MNQITLNNAIGTFKEKFKKSGELCEHANQFIPGGYSRNSLTFGPHAIYVERGDGQFIDTIDGERLLDFHNNFSANVVGHNHPKVREAIEEILAKGFSFGNPVPHEHELARLLCERIDAVEKVIFSCSATESCLSAIRIARANTGKNKIAKFEGGYHGMGDEFMMSLHPLTELFPGPSNHPIPVPNTAGLPERVRQEVVALPQNDLASCERILRAHANDTAGLIMELQTGAGGVIVLDKEFAQGIRALTQELGILMIIDETITLRASYHGMQSLYDVKPDLVVMGKAIGGGLPIGALGGRAEYFEMGLQGLVYHSGTHHGHPLATAAGLACMEVMDEQAHSRLNAYAERIKTELTRWVNENDYPFIIYGIGSHLGYEFTDEPGRQYKSCRDILQFSNEEHMQTFAFEMANRGIFPMFRGQMALSEPMREADIDQFVNTAQEIISGMLVDG